MLVSIDYMHWTWKNCLLAWQGHRVHCHDPTIILEVVASQHLWILNLYFGLLGTHNDLSVLKKFLLLQGSLSVRLHLATMLSVGTSTKWATTLSRRATRPCGAPGSHPVWLWYFLDFSRHKKYRIKSSWFFYLCIY